MNQTCSFPLNSTMDWNGLRSNRFSNHTRRHFRPNDTLSHGLAPTQCAWPPRLSFAINNQLRESKSPQMQFKPCARMFPEVQRLGRSQGIRTINFKALPVKQRAQAKHIQFTPRQTRNSFGIKTFKEGVSFETSHDRRVQSLMGRKIRVNQYQPFQGAAGRVYLHYDNSPKQFYIDQQCPVAGMRKTRKVQLRERKGSPFRMAFQ